MNADNTGYLYSANGLAASYFQFFQNYPSAIHERDKA
jgi:hypothetical protein